MLDAGNVIIATRIWYKNGEPSDQSHAILIHDYSYDSLNGIYVFDIMDPADDEENSCFSRSYAWIWNGSNAIEPVDTEDNGVWSDIVVFQIGDYTNTVPWTGG